MIQQLRHSNSKGDCDDLPHWCDAVMAAGAADIADVPVIIGRETGEAEPPEASATDRISISKTGKYILNDQEVVLMGGNYGLKAPPYFPELHIVQEDARIMAEGAKHMKFTPAPAIDGSQRKVVPMVRLNLYFEAAMPDQVSPSVDASFAKQLDETIAAFKAEGVYVMLDNHEDALSTVIGGEGFPWWMMRDMQSNAERGFCGCALPACCCCCCKCCCGAAWYYTAPHQPLEMINQPRPSFLQCLCCRSPYPTIEGDSDPWRAFSIGSDTGNPARMNIGNPSFRLNNPGAMWGNLSNSKQANNAYNRILAAPFHQTDRSMLFEPFMTYIKFLGRMWEMHHNVVALGLWNEPMVTGLPCRFWNTFRAVRLLYDWHAAIAEELDKADIQIPLCLEELPQGSLGSFSWVAGLFALAPMSSYARKILQKKANQGQIILEFHLYEGPLMPKTIPEGVEKAKKRAMQLFGERVPVYIGEFWPGLDGKTNEQAGANILAALAESGCDAMSYWFYANIPHCDGNDGWHKYPKHIQDRGLVIHPDTNTVNMEVWEDYVKTVHDGTSWGARITGASSACGDLLPQIPAKSPPGTKINS